MDVSFCDHDFIVDGVCQDCSEQVASFFQNDNSRSNEKKTVRKSNRNATDGYIKEVLDFIRDLIDVDIMTRVTIRLADSNIQIRNFEIARNVVFAYIYSEMYSRDLPPEELFTTAPNRLAALMGLSKANVGDALRCINNSKIRGPSFVMTHPYLYLLEFRRERPDSQISELIDDELIEKIKEEIDFEIHSIARENPAKIAIAYMSLLLEKNGYNERGGWKPIQEMYDFYGLEVSQVKDTIPEVKKFFWRDFPMKEK